jgi:ADP-ribosylglycohydrolase
MQRASGSLFGLAYGDALGKPTEFQDYATIMAEYGPDGPRSLPSPALVTDDTQMALAVADALLAALDSAGAALGSAAADPAFIEPIGLETALRREFLAWARSPDNNRAPGMTCLRACGNLAEGLRWQDATVPESKGCGANMRVTPVGLMPGLTDEQRAGAAQLQAALTHGHPTGLAASELTALAVRWLLDGLSPHDLVGALRQRCADQRGVYHERWLGDLWLRPGVDSPERFIAQGWDDCARALDRVAAAGALYGVGSAVTAGGSRPAAAGWAPGGSGRGGSLVGGDPCLVTGEGWIAEEALATALYCFLLSPDDPLTVIARGATSSGDSDSIACLAGAFAGATHGLAAWPAEWLPRIEYTDRLARIGAAWD